VVDTVIASDAEERRAVLLAVVRLHHHKVVVDAGTPSALKRGIAALPPEGTGLVALVDVDLSAPEWGELLRDLCTKHPDTRLIVVTPSRSTDAERLSREVRATQLLRRPFSIPQLLEALEGPGPKAPS
jgi:CheY-like chemotaxis protein